MLSRNFSIGLTAALSILAATLFVVDAPAVAQQYKILHSFCSGKDGCQPNGGLVFDSASNLYGTTEYGGPSTNCPVGCGTIFELSPKTGGGWSGRILHNFATGKGGAEPSGNLTIDAAGNLYGAAGVVFEITP